jgi:Uma2 family endonuclease
MGAIESPPLLQRHRLTVDEYYRMAETGVLAPDARVELIEGEIIDMAPMKSRHAGVVNELAARLHEAVGRRAVITCQTPLRLSHRSEPEPDLMLLRPRADHYGSSHPGAADVLLLIEVADSSARYDREIKVPLYARHGVAEVWVLDLDARRALFHRSGNGSDYADVTSSEAPGTVALPGLDGLSVDLSGLLA